MAPDTRRLPDMVTVGAVMSTPPGAVIVTLLSVSMVTPSGAWIITVLSCLIWIHTSGSLVCTAPTATLSDTSN